MKIQNTKIAHRHTSFQIAIKNFHYNDFSSLLSIGCSIGNTVQEKHFIYNIYGNT